MAEMTDTDDLLGGGMLSQEELDSLLAAASAEAGPDEWTGSATDEASAPEPMPSPPHAAPALMDLPAFGAPAHDSRLPDTASPGLSRVRDIPLEVTVELGRTRLLIRDILDLGAGSIIELDKIAGEAVELFANGLLIARGEVVVIDDNFGVRVTEIITAADRKGGKGADAMAA